MSFSLPNNPMMDLTPSLQLNRQDGVQASTKTATDEVDPRMRQAAEGFEALFLQQMVKAGRAASLGDDLLGGSGVSRMQSMLDQQLTEDATGAAGLGMADAIVRQFAPFAKKADG